MLPLTRGDATLVVVQSAGAPTLPPKALAAPTG